jgi:hypothetical protein
MSDNQTMPVLNPQPSPYDVPQNNNVLPRNLFTSGTIPGNTVLNIGDKNLQIDGKNTKESVYDTSGNEAVRMGKLPDGTYGIIVAKSGYDVSTATPDQLVMSSEFDMFKIASIVTYSYTITYADVVNSGVTITVTHGLGYKPMTMGSFYITATGNVYPLPWTFSRNNGGLGGLGDTGFIVGIQNITNTTFDIAMNITSTSGLSWIADKYGQPFNFKIYCLRETTV